MKIIHRIDSVFGGADFYDDSGNFVGHSVPGIGGGEDFFGVNGETGYSVPGIGGGQDFYFSDGRTAWSVDGVFGGQDIYGDVNGSSNGPLFGVSELFINDD